MNTPLTEQTLGSLACRIPGATRVFRHYRLDFCCGGNNLLRDAARERQLDAEAIAAELAQLSDTTDDLFDWQDASVAKLIEHILQRFHQRHREQFPQLIHMASRVEQAHAQNPDCPLGLVVHLWNMQQDLESHMLKEEQILFPLLLRGMKVPQAHGPIAVMRDEHEHHNAALVTLAKLTNDFSPPAQACNTWRTLYCELQTLRDDLMQHIHLENNILFIKGSAL